MHSSGMHTARSLTMMEGGVPAPGGCLVPGGGVPAPGRMSGPKGGVWSQGGCLLLEGYHVTYPIMHLMLPVCCLHTN